MAKPKMEDFTRLNLYVPLDLKEFYREEGNRVGLNMSSMCNVVLRQYMDQKTSERAIQAMKQASETLDKDEVKNALEGLTAILKGLPVG